MEPGWGRLDAFICEELISMMLQATSSKSLLITHFLKNGEEATREGGGGWFQKPCVYIGLFNFSSLCLCRWNTWHQCCV